MATGVGPLVPIFILFSTIPRGRCRTGASYPSSSASNSIAARPISSHEFGDVAYRLRVGYQRVVVGSVELNPTCGDCIQHLFARVGVQRTL
ncbi:uncharacterized protein ATNIH1004_011781 [Aspergillus tanneri]|uniref:Uncharacterized protein n=1 Tax=Aspergillus tanneri TaxID=1220188 RepID=A0A5M9M3T3_9EURO|nr:uncharacterized protein ATNIH1004_011781 [Aspergillus tanneri]KAA8641645.1 hypothetical protein ATNIH1004_011781 [Aspergillus tanneri]